MAGEVRPRPSPAPSHSTPSLTAPVCHRPAQRTTEIPANSRHHGPRAVPSVSSVLSLPPGPSQTVIGAPKSACRPPGDLPPTRIQARIIAPVTPSHPSAVLTPSTCMNRWIRAKDRRDALLAPANERVEQVDVRCNAPCAVFGPPDARRLSPEGVHPFLHK